MPRAILWQRFEGAAVFAAGLAIYLGVAPGLPWWAAILLFFAPDLSFGGYLAGPKVGSVVYNLVHVYAFGALVLAAGIVTASLPLAGLGALWLAHSGFDRMFGYGLKLPEGFNQTHLGEIGRKG
ncbi:DUF4260 domain-containing protein [Pseudoroseicyclus sp. CXY001]|uniref:DUF4260 domain-containing protein n=1 Tax=Pseudoroseicyclus sp. CXY001 TaxID=3242492 RepID=UPI00358DC1A8